MKNLILSGSMIFFANLAQANFIGTDYQNFNPTYSSLDFTTVQSSEIIKPCLCHIGLFFNYAKNTLTYSESYIAAGSGGITDLKGIRAKDSMTAADVLIGFGVTKNFDLGLALPFVVAAKNDDPYGVSYFDKFGLTEFRPTAKYRFYGDNNGGMAVLLSANLNQIKDNPFAGTNSGPTVNLELVGDTTISDYLKLGLNLGYRKRSPGSRITNPTTGEAPPFVPYKDSVIYSLAAAAPVSFIKSDVVLELKGSTSVSGTVDQDTKRSQQGMELGLGVRSDFTEDTNFHAGLGTKLASAQASPDFRIHLGISTRFGEACDDEPKTEPRYVEEPKVGTPPRAVFGNVPNGESEQTNLEATVSALNPSDYAAYKYKIGPTNEIDCRQEEGYSDEMAPDSVIYANLNDFPDGFVTLCALAKNNGGEWQPVTDPTIHQWKKFSRKLEVIQKDGYELFRLSAEVLFDFNKDEIRAIAKDDLDRISKYLKQKPFRQVIIEGHTDSKGSDQYNLNLSQRRAEQVKKWLVEKYDFNGSQFKPVGKGEKFPVDTNETDGGRQQNRRVEFKVYR